MRLARSPSRPAGSTQQVVFSCSSVTTQHLQAGPVHYSCANAGVFWSTYGTNSNAPWAVPTQSNASWVEAEWPRCSSPTTRNTTVKLPSRCHYEVYVVPFPNTGAAKWLVSTRGGTEPVWSHSGKELFYRDGDTNLVAVRVRTTPTFSVGDAVVLFPAAGFRSGESRAHYDVSLDDRRFLMIRRSVVTADGLVAVENWFEELKAKSSK